jgi:DNA-binding GntR family transcriptional regulator
VADTRELRSYLVASAHGDTTDAVTDALREAVLSGALPPSTWLRERELAGALAVSRTPVREALRRLSDEGLTVRVPNRGTAIAPMSVDDILSVYTVRESLEGLAARAVALRRPPGLVDALSAVHQEMSAIHGELAAGGGDRATLFRLNLDFHRLLREGSGNPYLERFLTQVEHSVRRFGRSAYESADRVGETLKEHYAILGAIGAGDADEAERQACAHMRRSREVRLAHIMAR